MPKTKIVYLTADVNGIAHKVKVERNRKIYIVNIDDQQAHSFKLGKNSSFGPCEDFPLDVHGESFIISVRTKTIRLVKNGRYTDNGEEFTPATPPPKWAWIFFALNIILVLPGVAGGAIGGAFGAGGAFGCMAAARKGKNTAKNVFYCILITIGCWAGTMLVGGIVWGLLS